MKTWCLIFCCFISLKVLSKESLEQNLGRLACLAGAIHPDPDIFDENVPEQLKQHCPSQGHRPRFKSAPKTNAIKRIFDSLYHTIFGPTVRRGISEKKGCQDVYIQSITQDNLSFQQGSLEECIASLYFDQLHHHPSRIPMSRINSCEVYFCAEETVSLLQEYFETQPNSKIKNLRRFLHCPDAQFQI